MQEAARRPPPDARAGAGGAILEATMFGPLRRDKRPRNACQRLRTAVEAMPRRSREAMLRGIEDNTIIVGAYTDPESGGICPMLAAHRNGGRIDLSNFARSWDRYTDAREPRPATRREILTLVSLLESSLAEDVDLLSVEPPAGPKEPSAPAAPPAPAVAPPERPGFRIRIRRLRPRSAQVANADGSPRRAKTTSGIRQ
jgi:hypothetical protein